MSSATYTRYELLRTVRERRLMIFGFGFPLVLYFVIAVPNRHMEDFAGSGVTAPLYYMVSLASFGTMMSMVSLGGRIAGEREAGWTRQLRITPLSPRSYLRAKVMTGYTMAALSLGLLYIAGAALGVSLSASEWIKTTLLIAVALLPFAALGIGLGHLLTVDSVGPAIGGTVSLLALVSGTWFPVTSGFLHDLGQCLPSYWLVQAGRVSIDGQPWGALGWAVVLGWTVVLVAFAGWAYMRDTGRV
ncbi:MAG TPA: ABC transporter permease [Solirubrobacteraceae bacterium]|jgi:ABC-2 type transport system permease protein|nr:ABC transporter permease [Solirubrobacteraceae bacterium]